MSYLEDAEGSCVTTGDGRKVVLGKLIKSGGAGSVYRLRDSTTQVAKLYHAGIDLRVYERKTAAMLELEPELPVIELDGTRYVQIAWPDTAIRDARGRYLGYLMPLVDIDATSELECILQEKQARAHGLPTGLGAKVTLAANLAAVIAALHRQRHYVVDLKPVNLRFYRRSLYMAMLDADGFSIQGRGERLEAPQYTPDYLAPEFQARGLTTVGEAQQDRFALAVVVFQLLNFGIHPFTGRPTSDHVPTDIPGRIAGRWYAYGLKPNKALLPSPVSGHAAMPTELRQLFDRAFESAGSTRPSADEWSALLRQYAQRAAGKLVVCGKDAAHQHFAAADCAACARTDLLNGARAAAARTPKRAPPLATTRRAPFAMPPKRTAANRPPSPPPRSATPSPKPTATSVLARLRAAGVATAPPASKPPSRRPANWPRPAPPASPAPTRHVPQMWQLKVLLIAVGIFAILVRMFIDTLGDYRDVAQSDYPVPAPVVQPAVVPAPDPPIANPTPGHGPVCGELSSRGTQFRSVVEAMALGVRDENAFAVERGLQGLRSGRFGRDMVTGPIDDGGPEAPATGDVLLQRGWLELQAGYPIYAENCFLIAMTQQSDAAEAWVGYALAQSDPDIRVGALALAMLLYPSREEFDARLTAVHQDVLPGMGITAERFATTLKRANDSAVALESRLAPGTVSGVALEPLDGTSPRR